ncbi:hemolysin family protein [Virgibacillus byunsanensis]|uniref:Hemolysin family protein n=1 Tax=Virgibacillus byunsanensis TaxID=570945 RepID=A0ABW3LPV7_9BACI
METIPLGSIILLIILLVWSAFFAGAETIYSSVNKIRLKQFVKEGRSGSKKALSIAEDFDSMISAVLVGNNITNTAAATISAQIFIETIGGNLGVIINTVVMTVIILIFAEVLPKTLAKEKTETLAISFSGIMNIIIKICTPINILLAKLTEYSLRLFKEEKGFLPSVTEEEIKLILDISEKEGVIDKLERKLILRSMHLDETPIKEIMTPRIDIVAININQPIEEIIELFFESRFSRVPVYKESNDNIIGILTEKDFLNHLITNDNIDIRELLREPIFILESMKISSILPQLKKEKIPMAIVLDEFSGTAGLVTLKDILEEIVGEILDDRDEKVELITKVGENVYTFHPKYQLYNFAEKFNIRLPKSDYYTLGGWIIENLETVPSKGASFTYENLKVSVEDVEDRRIKRIKVEIKSNIKADDHTS